MVRGFYSAASGILSRQKSMDAVSNNIANVTTAGYKGQGAIESSFGEHLVARLGGSAVTSVGPGALMTVNADTYTDFSQGMFEHTGRSVDFAINGEGFFVARSEKYGDVLTRNGQAMLDKDGHLVIPGIGRLLGEGGREITLKSSNFSIGEDGTIYEEGRKADKLYVAVSEDGSDLIKVGRDAFKSLRYQRADEKSFSIMQFHIEKANVNIVKELSRLIAGQSHFQSCAQVLKIYDKINELGVNRIGSLD